MILLSSEEPAPWPSKKMLNAQRLGAKRSWRTADPTAVCLGMSVEDESEDESAAFDCLRDKCCLVSPYHSQGRQAGLASSANLPLVPPAAS